MNLIKMFPKLTFFVARGDWKENFIALPGHPNFKVMTRVFCTLESSLGIKSITPFLDGNSLESIDFWEPELHHNLAQTLCNPGIAFAETGLVYKKKDLEQFREDYYITILLGMSS